MTQYPLTDMYRGAIFSDCGTYRYSLTRRWEPEKRIGRLVGGRVCFIMLNPSVADQYHDDQTTIQCVKRVKQFGFSTYEAVNLFALISTYPLMLRDHDDPVGPQNNAYIHRALGRADQIVVAWGNLGDLYDRAAYIMQHMLRGRGEIWCLGQNQTGHPRFPLRVSYKQRFKPLVYSQPYSSVV